VEAAFSEELDERSKAASDADKSVAIQETQMKKFLILTSLTTLLAALSYEYLSFRQFQHRVHLAGYEACVDPLDYSSRAGCYTNWLQNPNPYPHATYRHDTLRDWLGIE
jgi:hypothetical protein